MAAGEAWRALYDNDDSSGEEATVQKRRSSKAEATTRPDAAPAAAAARVPAPHSQDAKAYQPSFTAATGRPTPTPTPAASTPAFSHYSSAPSKSATSSSSFSASYSSHINAYNFTSGGSSSSSSRKPLASPATASASASASSSTSQVAWANLSGPRTPPAPASDPPALGLGDGPLHSGSKSVSLKRLLERGFSSPKHPTSSEFSNLTGRRPAKVPSSAQKRSALGLLEPSSSSSSSESEPEQVEKQKETTSKAPAVSSSNRAPMKVTQDLPQLSDIIKKLDVREGDAGQPLQIGLSNDDIHAVIGSATREALTRPTARRLPHPSPSATAAASPQSFTSPFASCSARELFDGAPPLSSSTSELALKRQRLSAGRTDVDFAADAEAAASGQDGYHYHPNSSSSAKPRFAVAAAVEHGGGLHLPGVDLEQVGSSSLSSGGAAAAMSPPPPKDGWELLQAFPGPDEGRGTRWSEGALALSGGAVLPEPIAGCLRRYQREGVRWMFDKLFIENRGCLLADEMGLGKTVQVACCLAAGLFGLRSDPSKDGHKESMPSADGAASPPAAPNRPKICGGRGPVLVLCPPSLVQNWARELSKWGPFKVEIWPSSNQQSTAGSASGGAASGHNARQRTMRRLEGGLVDVLVASRGLVGRGDEEGAAAGADHGICSLEWGCVVVDEVHQARNPKSQLHRGLAALKSTRKLGLTGTPFQNSIRDVWALLHVVGAHDPWDLNAFEARFGRPITKGQKKNATVKDLTVREDALKEFRELLMASCLRRTKDEVSLMLPGKNDRVVPCPLSPVQRAAYQNLINSPDFQMVLNKRRVCICGAGRPCMCGTGPVWRYIHQRQAETKGLEDEWAAADDCACRGRSPPRCLGLSLIVLLQRITNHIELLKPDPQPPKNDSERAQQALMKELCSIAFAGIDHNLCSNRQISNRMLLGSPEACGKMQVLLPLLRHWRRRGQKVLVFSRSTRLLDILEACLWQQGSSPQVLRLDGGTPPGQRQKLVDEFNTCSTRGIFLISTRAGGVGLNLTSASVVVIFDPDWNPFSDLQAQDRSFRIGQTRVVEVYRLLGAGTIEEQVYVRQVWKQQLAAAAIDGCRTARHLEGGGAGIAALMELREESLLPALMAEAYTKSSAATAGPPTGVPISKRAAVTASSTSTSTSTSTSSAALAAAAAAASAALVGASATTSGGGGGDDEVPGNLQIFNDLRGGGAGLKLKDLCGPSIVAGENGEGDDDDDEDERNEGNDDDDDNENDEKRDPIEGEDENMNDVLGTRRGEDHQPRSKKASRSAPPKGRGAKRRKTKATDDTTSSRASASATRGTVDRDGFAASEALEVLHGMFDHLDHSKLMRNDTQARMQTIPTPCF